jgi:demethylmenaquinone methyltransferase/2-methoxy-6-polyprenyl-1,4-benzoquinol methylase
LLEGSVLSRLWKDVVKSIEELSERGCYERVNEFMGFLSVERLRRELARNVKGERILDIGCGPGNLSLILCEEVNDLKELILVDPSKNMVSKALRLLKNLCIRKGVRVNASLGMFESIPLRSSSVDSVVTAFAFRDAVDYERALDEMQRVLKPGGVLGILDLYRPSSKLIDMAVKIYLTLIPPLGSIILGCPRHLGSYVLLRETIKRMPTERKLNRMIAKRLHLVSFKSFYPGVGLWVAKKEE